MTFVEIFSQHGKKKNQREFKGTFCKNLLHFIGRCGIITEFNGMLSPYWEIEEPFAVYADAACTQTFEEDWDVNADLTIYVKWGE